MAKRIRTSVLIFTTNKKKIKIVRKNRAKDLQKKGIFISEDLI